MKAKNEILRICNDGKVFIHGELVDNETVKEILSKLSNYIPVIEVEEELPHKGQVCWGRRQKSIWFIGHFIGKEDGEYILSPDIEGINSKYYDELTTKNPYEVVSEMENTDRDPQIGDVVFAWDNQIINIVVCGELENIDSAHQYPFTLKEGFSYKHCSLKNPLIK